MPLIVRLGIALLLLAGQCAAAAINLTDDTCHALHLARTPQRIVALAPHVTELVYAVGAGAQLVGADSASDYPDEVRELQRIGDYSRIHFERVAALKPDLVIGWAGGNRASDIHKLRQMGLPVLLTDAHRLQDVARLLRLIGKATGQAQQGELAARDFERKLDALRRQYRNAPPRRVFYEVWERPLMTIGGPHWISDVLVLCGGRNIFSELAASAPAVSVEAVLARAPEVIVSGTDAPDVAPFWARFTTLPAVKRQAFIRIDASTLHRPTPRLLEGAATLCAKVQSR